MDTIKKSDIRKIVKELFRVQPVNSPFDGEVVTVNDVMDDTLKNFCQQVSKNNCKSEDEEDESNAEANGLYYETIIRRVIRSILNGEKK